LFGDDRNGKVPPASTLVVAREYQAGGGKSGNLPARMIKQAPGGAAVQEVFNALAAEGGTDAEPAATIAGRGPRALRRRGRAMTARDYEVLAFEAAPEVAWARVFPASDVHLGRRPGHVLIMLLPETKDRRPWPSFGLRERVRKHIEARALSGLCVSRCIHVTGPRYFPVDVEVAVVPKVASEAGTVEKRVRAALEDFLHPLRGGPRGQGWELGRDVFLSDVAAVVENVAGVDFAKEIALLRDNTPQGESVAVPRDLLVVAGDIRIKVLLA
jgi:predicted phage baseplate assembly protein